MKHRTTTPRPPSGPGRRQRVGPIHEGRRAGLVRTLALIAGALHLPGARAESDPWPRRPIRLVVPYPPGGPLDLSARALADAMRVDLGQPVLVENKPAQAAISVPIWSRRPKLTAIRC